MIKLRQLVVLTLTLQACRQRATPLPPPEPAEVSPADASPDVLLDVDLCHDEHPPALHVGCGRPNIRMVRNLLGAGAPVDQQDGCGRTPIMWTFSLSVPEVSLSLHPSQAEVDRVNRRLSSENAARMEIAWLLLKRGANAKSVDRDGNSVLLEAAGFGGGGPRLVEIVKRLLQNGAAIEQANKLGTTPLMAAAWSGRIDVARILLSEGASLTARDTRGWTAIDIARSAGRDQMVSLLQNARRKQ